MKINPATISLFSYTEEERDTFPYLRHYMQMIEPQLPRIKCNTDHVELFMLSGLFLTYRAFNHMGIELSTRNGAEVIDSIHSQRLLKYKEVTGKDIDGAIHYLELINFSLPNMLWHLGPAKMLYHFVMHGHCLAAIAQTQYSNMALCA